MRDSVRQAFAFFSAGFEGRVAVMYLDTHTPPLVTTGIGNLIDPISEALALPWRDILTNLPVSQAEITREWTRVKELAAHSRDRASFWVTSAKLRLAPQDIDALVLSKLEQFEAKLKARAPFVNYEDWPADAQLALSSMAWAMGPHFQFPSFQLACSRMDFAGAAAECRMDDSHNAGLTPRNAANQKLFMNAAAVRRKGLDPETLFYPQFA